MYRSVNKPSLIWFDLKCIGLEVRKHIWDINIIFLLSWLIQQWCLGARQEAGQTKKVQGASCQGPRPRLSPRLTCGLEAMVPKFQQCLTSANQKITIKEKTVCLILNPCTAYNRNETVVANTLETITRTLWFSVHHHWTVSLWYPYRYIHKHDGNFLQVHHSKVII